MFRKLLIAGSLLAAICASAQKHRAYDYRYAGAKMPPIRAIVPKSLQLAESADEKTNRYPGMEKNNSVVTEADFPRDGNLFLVLFNPTCEHCQDQARLFRDQAGRLVHSRVLFLATPVMLPHLQTFDNLTRISGVRPKVQIGIDSSDVVGNVFLYEGLPQINIYNHDRVLIKTFGAGAPLDSLQGYFD